MSEDKVKAKTEGVDVSGYMPPGPVSPFPPGGQCPPMPCPDDHHMMGTLAKKLMALMGQEVTVYVMGMGPLVPVPVLPSGGGAVVPAGGPMGITGILHEVGMDYLTLHVVLNTMRVVYIPFMAISAVVPGGPLVPNVEANTITTVPETI